MAKLTLYIDRGVRSTVAKMHLDKLGVDYDVINTDEYPSQLDKLRPIKTYGLPQYYVGETLAFSDGYKQVKELTAEEINQRVEEINVSNT
jgi:hypothetical protein